MVTLEEALANCRRVTARSGSGPRFKLDWEGVVRAWFRLGNQHEVARELRLQQSKVSGILIRCGVSVGRGKRKPVHVLDMDDVVRRYRAGENCPEIGASLGVSSEVIRRRLRSIGEPRRQRGGYELRGAKNPQWKGGRSSRMHYYRRQAYEVAAICLGQPTPEGTIIHHVDENPENNAPGNLMLFPGHSEHSTYHQRVIKLQKAGTTYDPVAVAIACGAVRVPDPPHVINL